MRDAGPIRKSERLRGRCGIGRGHTVRIIAETFRMQTFCCKNDGGRSGGGKALSDRIKVNRNLLDGNLQGLMQLGAVDFVVFMHDPIA